MYQYYKTITSPYVHSRFDSSAFTMGIGQPYARVDFIPKSETLDLASGFDPSVFLPTEEICGAADRECLLENKYDHLLLSFSLKLHNQLINTSHIYIL